MIRCYFKVPLFGNLELLKLSLLKHPSKSGFSVTIFRLVIHQFNHTFSQKVFFLWAGRFARSWFFILSTRCPINKFTSFLVFCWENGSKNQFWNFFLFKLVKNCLNIEKQDIIIFVGYNFVRRFVLLALGPVKSCWQQLSVFLEQLAHQEWKKAIHQY